MRPRLCLFLLVAVVLSLALPGIVSAQGAPPVPDHYGPGYGSTPSRDIQPPDPLRDPDGDTTERLPRFTGTASLSGEESVALGQPGTSFRYVRTFGETDIAYLADTTHLNYPYGIGTNGNDVWMAELWGQRALKYGSDGTFVASIGKGGTHGPFWEPNDIAVDASGHTWVTHAGGVTEFDDEGNELRSLQADFWAPAGIAFDAGGNIYVSDGAPWHSDEGNQRILIFNPAGDYFATIGTSGAAGTGNLQFRGPKHITIYDDKLYVADSGNHRVQVIDVSDPEMPAYRGTIGVTGESGSNNAHLNNPSGVAVDANYIYVADRWNNRVQVFARGALSYVATVGAWGHEDGQFWEPTDVAVDASGNLYVADFVNTRVQQFSPSRSFQRTFGVTETPYLTDAWHYNRPTGVAVAPDGSIYITEQMGHRLVKLSASGEPIWTVGKAGVAGDWYDTDDRLDGPSDVAVDPAGRVYVTDRWDGRIQIYTPDGSYYATLGDRDSVGCPSGVAVAANGWIYVSDSCNQRVQVFSAAFQPQATLGANGEAGSDNAHFDNPEDVAVDSRGIIYVSDRGNHRVQVFNSNRQYARTIGVTGECGGGFGHFCAPNNLAVDAANRLYVADSDNARVQVFDGSGAYLTTVGGRYGGRPGEMQSADGVAIGPNGDLYVAEWNGMRVQKFALGTPGWKQVNLNGFGDRWSTWISTLLPFQGSLYAAGYPARVWRMSPAGAWSQTNVDGFGDDTNNEIDALTEFNGQLYAATYTWVCDDEDCNTGHTNGPQIWRTGNGTNWQNVTPPAGIGSGDRYVDSLAVFDGQLYAGLGVSNTGKGAEIWRTADGLTWTRVVANGFADDIYNTDASALVVYNGSLYAGTRHGDYWHDDGHADGPLGGEIWRSQDGATWTRVNAPGFGNLEAYRVENLLVFQNALYAYISHWGGTTAGADVWRCAKTICAEQGDWTQVAANGFGVPQNQFLYAGAVADSHLYAAVYNASTGVQLWRTANGTNWEKATPYDGLGDSNNSYVYRHAMTVFNNRLILGVNNGANGAEVWASSLTADFTATPSRGKPPLTVQFTNTSAGDYTTSQWDFGDGATSTEKHPAHTYAAAGKYTVKLTVGDGTDTSMVSRQAVWVGYPLYLPLVDRNHDPLMYDNFDDTAWDGAWNPAKWSPSQGSTTFRQQAGALVMTEPASANPTGGQFRAVSPQFRSWKQTHQVGARFKVSSDRTGGWSPIGIAFVEEEVNGHGWYVACRLGGSGGASQASFRCSVFIRQGDSYPSEYETPDFRVDYNTWCTARIETNPTTGNVKFYLNNTLIGSHVPNDAGALVVSDELSVLITNWGGDANSAATRYVDDVRITPAK